MLYYFQSEFLVDTETNKPTKSSHTKIYKMSLLHVFLLFISIIYLCVQSKIWSYMKNG